MNKIVIMIGVCLSWLCTQPIFGQRKFQQKHALGVTGGLNISSMSFSPIAIPQDQHLGPSVGVVYRFLEEYLFGIQAELLYTQRGWKEELEAYPELNYARSLNYLELPILSHINFGNKHVKGFVNLGPKFGLFLNDKSVTNIVDPIPDYTQDQQTLEVSRKLDYGITGGAGIEVMFGGNQGIALEARYYFGLNDIFPNEKGETFETSSNQSISVHMTYFFYWNRR